MKPILEEAHEVIYGDREDTYGDPGKNLRIIADYWENYLLSRGLLDENSGGVLYYDVANMMALMKIARLGNSPLHHDSMVDACGYMALADRVKNANRLQEKETPCPAAT